MHGNIPSDQRLTLDGGVDRIADQPRTIPLRNKGWGGVTVTGNPPDHARVEMSCDRLVVHGAADPSDDRARHVGRNILWNHPGMKRKREGGLRSPFDRGDDAIVE